MEKAGYQIVPKFHLSSAIRWANRSCKSYFVNHATVSSPNHLRQWEEMLSSAELAYNSMINHSTGKSPFNIVYTNLALDVAVLPKYQSEPASNFTRNYSQMLEEVRKQLIKSNQSYKAAADVHRRQKLFNVEDLVMVHMRRERFPPGTNYSKLHRRKIGPLLIIAKINDNAYTVELPADTQTSLTFNVSDIWPYHSHDDAPNITISSSESSSSSAGED
ncbi:uncharacterized protein LOC110110136 [Dendrobium catenatum]|uniref:uncharacterized protein LOC110110136 n=1 Tax=Dendrobium catenatum TaxID=906689 RepID=UPI0009F301EC|nr:uncharacterized protein LOC110110136 [Dendrobium catenatum]